jgi:protein TonB
MSVHLSQKSRFRTGGELLLWTSAALCVAAVHAGAVALLLQQPEIELADAAPPAAIMIELAPEPEAAAVDEEQIVPDTVDAEEIKTASHEPAPVPVKETPPEPMPQPLPEPPVEEVAEALPEPVIEPPPLPEPLPEPVEEVDPIEQLVMAQLENVAVPIPVVRPPLPKPVEEKPKKQPEKKKASKPKAPAAPTSKAALQAKAEVKQSNRTAAQQTTSGSGSNVSPAKWRDRVRAHIARRAKSLSRTIAETSMVQLHITFDKSGNVLSVSARSSSGDASLDQVAAAMVRRSSPLPAPPAGVPNYLSLPVRFK